MKTFFCNRTVDKNEMKRLIKWVLLNYGSQKATRLVDQLKTLGFHYATHAGISLGIDDLRIPPVKASLLLNAETEIANNETRWARGQITAVDKLEKALDVWNTTNDTLKNAVIDHFRETDVFNPVYMMAFSGARGNISQVRQLVGMRGLMSDPQGQILDFPIRRNFREGLTVTEYMISCYGARKGLVDTALRTANSGYLTRRLVDVAQSVIVQHVDCHPSRGLTVGTHEPRFEDKVIGRVLFRDVIQHETGQVLARKNMEISSFVAQRISQAEYVMVRSPLTCNFQSVCQRCYGWSLAQQQLVQLGEAVGVLAAQSIGEPGTQLTMRTFHTGGVFAGEATEKVYSPHAGKIEYLSTLRGHKVTTYYGETAFLSLSPVQLRIRRRRGHKSAIVEFPSLTLLFARPGEYVNYYQTLAELSRVDWEATKLTRQKTTTLESSQAQDGPVKQVKAEYDGQIYQTNGSGQSRQTHRLWNIAGEFRPIRRLLPGDSWNQECQRLHPRNSHPVSFQTTTEGPSAREEESPTLHHTTVLAKTTLQDSLRRYWKHITPPLSRHTYKVHHLGSQDSMGRAVQVCNTGVGYTSQWHTGLYQPPTTPPTMTQHGRHVASEPIHLDSVHSQEWTLLPQRVTPHLPPNARPRSRYTHLRRRITRRKATRKRRFLYRYKVTHFQPFRTLAVSLPECEQVHYSEQHFFCASGQFFPTSLGSFHQPTEQGRARLEWQTAVETQQRSLRASMEAETGVVGSHPRLSSSTASPQLFPQQVEPVPGLAGHPTQWQPVTAVHVPLSSQPAGPLASALEQVPHQFASLGEARFYQSEPRTSDLDHGGMIVAHQSHLHAGVSRRQLPEEPVISPLLCNLRALTQQPKRTSLRPRIEKRTLSRRVDAEVSKCHTTKLGDTVGEYVAPALLRSKPHVAPVVPHRQNRAGDSFCLTSRVQKCFASAEPTDHLRMGTFVCQDDLLSTRVRLPFSGQLIVRRSHHLVFRRVQAYKVLTGCKMVVHVRHGGVVKTNEPLLSIPSVESTAGDIVQGLPKVDELLEARETTVAGPRKQNMHEMLAAVFGQYAAVYGMRLGCEYSFYVIRQQLVHEVQAVYQSQGVFISDKHVEIIVRQMTGKVVILEPGRTGLLPGDIVDFRRAERMSAQDQATQKGLQYEPILLGITRASLAAESFIAAASFQETKRVLARSALEGRTDWLLGLKENVILGRLIPAGTGFYFG